MLLIEFILALLTTVIAGYGILQINDIVKRSPINEDKLLVAAMSLIFLMFVALIPVTILHQPSGFVDPLGVIYHKISFSFGQIAVYLVTLSIFLPIFDVRYRHITFLITFTVINFGSFFVNGITLHFEIVKNNIIVLYTPLGFMFFILSLVVLMVMTIKRVYDVQKTLNLNKQGKVNTKSLVILTSLLAMMTSTLVVTRYWQSLNVPGLLWLLPASVIIAYLSRSLREDPALFFITASILDAILVIHQTQGLTLYSKSFCQGYPPEDALSSIFSALNISLSKAIQANSRLEEVRFGNKVVILAPGKFITTALIVSQWNLITNAITKSITKEFEKRYEHILIDLPEKEGEKIFDIGNFQDFDEYVKTIRKFYLSL